MNGAHRRRAEPIFDAEEIDDVYHRLELSLHAPRSTRRPVVRWVALAALVACVVGAIVWPRDEHFATKKTATAPARELGAPEPIAPEAATALRIEGESADFHGFSSALGASVALTDGSRIEVGPRTRLTARENTGTAFHLVMSEGVATFDVRPGGPRAWSIDAGRFVAEVVGTRFTIESSADFASIRVEHGIVRVRGALLHDGERRVVAGETLRVPAEEARIESPRNWRELAEQGDYDGAFVLIDESGFEGEVMRAPDVETLFALADTARLSGHPARAREPLAKIVDEHAGDPRAAIAAFTLGRLEIDSMHRPEVAATWFERAIALGLSGSLRDAAERRLLEIRQEVEEPEHSNE